MNKEQKKFEEVIKKRRGKERKVRGRRQGAPRSRPPKPVIVPVRIHWWRKIINWLKSL